MGKGKGDTAPEIPGVYKVDYSPPIISRWWGRKSSEEEGKEKGKGRLFSSPRERKGLILCRRGRKNKEGEGKGEA